MDNQKILFYPRDGDMELCKNPGCTKKGLKKFNIHNEIYCEEHYSAYLKTKFTKDQLRYIKKAIQAFKIENRNTFNANWSEEEINNYNIEFTNISGLEMEVDRYILEFMPEEEEKRLEQIKEIGSQIYQEITH